MIEIPDTCKACEEIADARRAGTLFQDQLEALGIPQAAEAWGTREDTRTRSGLIAFDKRGRSHYVPLFRCIPETCKPRRGHTA